MAKALSCPSFARLVEIHKEQMRNKHECISRLRSEQIAGALQTLPDCETATEQFMEAVYDDPKLGRVVFLCKRFRYSHGKSTTWFWSAHNAILEQDLLAYRRAG